MRDELPDIPGFTEHYGASAFHCPTCDGYESRDCQVLVVGWSEHVAAFALNLLDWARTVTLVTDGRFGVEENPKRQGGSTGASAPSGTPRQLPVSAVTSWTDVAPYHSRRP